jgi:hypothetical protein
MGYNKNPATMYAILDELSKLKALDIDYDNLSSGLVSTKIQGAIDELSVLVSGGTVSVDASGVTYDNTNNSYLTATNVQDAIDQGDKGIYPIGNWINFIENYTTPSNRAIVSGQIKGIINYIFSTVKFNKVRMTVGIASSGNAVIGVYKYISPSVWKLVAQASGEINLASATVQELSFPSEVTLTKGIYSFCVHLQNSTTIQAVTAVNRTIFGYNSGMNISAHGTAMYFSATYTGTLPDTIAAGAGSADGSFYPHLIFNITG